MGVAGGQSHLSSRIFLISRKRSKFHKPCNQKDHRRLQLAGVNICLFVNRITRVRPWIINYEFNFICQRFIKPNNALAVFMKCTSIKCHQQQTLSCHERNFVFSISFANYNVTYLKKQRDKYEFRFIYFFFGLLGKYR